MGQSTSGRLSGRCQTCGKPHYADDLKRLAKLVSRCCVVRPVRRSTALEICPPLPLLPWRCEVDRSIASQNESTYSHWTVYSRDKRAWRRQLAVACREIAGLRLPWSRWRLERHYAPPAREYDYANLVGGAKPIADCLKELGVIVDDRPSAFDASYTQMKDDRNYTTLILEEV